MLPQISVFAIKVSFCVIYNAGDPYTVGLNMASIVNNLNAGFCGTRQSLSEFRLCLVIREYHMNPVHLDDKSDLAVIPFFRSRSEFVQMLHTPFCRRVREQADSLIQIRCQRAPAQPYRRSAPLQQTG